ncbi:MAG TPA: ABC transporter ATP-binding protein [Ktedonobacterales bacterium]|nr:ABC transporter ATP-binding protein [Ktedonobacterales bacterium]
MSARFDIPLLEVRNLSVDYFAEGGTVHAVSDVSFTLHRGEILGLAGESGCGKSTLAYALTRLLNPLAEVTGGEVIYYRPGGVDGGGESAPVPANVLALAPRELRAFRWSELAIVFQSAMNSLNPVMTLGAQIDDTLRTHRAQMSRAERTARAVELLRLVGIAPDRLKSYPHELSGGMRQRAGIAIALALSPDIVIMDEPTTALDVVVQREILTEILRLRDTLGFSVIFITHDLSLLLELADSIAIMYAGRIVERGPSRALYERPRHPYSYGLIHAFPPLRGPRRRAIGIPGTPPDLRAAPPGCAFHPRCPLAIDACRHVLPALRPAPGAPDVAVACHLYDATYAQTPPTIADIAAGYAAAADRSESTTKTQETERTVAS